VLHCVDATFSSCFKTRTLHLSGDSPSDIVSTFHIICTLHDDDLEDQESFGIPVSSLYSREYFCQFLNESFANFSRREDYSPPMLVLQLPVISDFSIEVHARVLMNVVAVDLLVHHPVGI
jgi:hypothetical protein